MKLDGKTLELLAGMVCGDTEGFPYRTGSDLTRFFHNLVLPFTHRGQTRKWWVLNALSQLDSGDDRADRNLPPPEFVKVIERLADPVEYETSEEHEVAVRQLNYVLGKEGLRILTWGRRPLLANIETGSVSQETARSAPMAPQMAILEFLEPRRDQVVSDAAIAAHLRTDVVLVRGYLDDLELGRFVEVSRAFGGGYSASATRRGSVLVRKRRTAETHGRAKPAPKVPAARKTRGTARPQVTRTGKGAEEYFVAHEFSRAEVDDLRRAIAQALAGLGLKPYYADNEVREGHIFKDKIVPKIRHARFGIYDVSNPDKPNVFMELGAAIGMGKRYFIICRRGTKLPSDIQGLDRIEYESYSQLARDLKAKIPDALGGHS